VRHAAIYAAPDLGFGDERKEALTSVKMREAVSVARVVCDRNFKTNFKAESQCQCNETAVSP
jgi:hypothetical protein